MLSGFSLITPVLADGTGAGGNAASSGSPWTIFLWLIPMALIFYFMGIRPQKKREKQAAEMRASLSLGDEIVTIGGICGRVIRIKDDAVTILTADSKMVFLKTAIGSVTRSAADFEEETPKKPAKAEDKPAAEAEENGSADDASPDGQSADKKDKKKGLSKKKED
jgi:preprotein translocase subunit YajC